MPTLDDWLIRAGYRTINVKEASSIRQTRWSSRITVVTTFIGTLFLPIQFAVGLGVRLTILNHVRRFAVDFRAVQLVPLPENRFEEREPPKQLPNEAITIRDAYGSLFFAGARTLEKILPPPRGAERSVVGLRMRGRAQVSATFIEVLDSYAEAIGEARRRLYLAGVDRRLQSQLMRTDRFCWAGVISCSVPVRPEE
jgi:SulP family sulfate permease